MSGFPPVEFPRAHFSLQLAYAQRARQLTGLSLPQALLEFTQFWRRIHPPASLAGQSWSFDPLTPPWQELCARLQAHEPADEVAYALYLRHQQARDPSKAYVGCFRYELLPALGGQPETIRLHFQHRDASGVGPLTTARQAVRQAELARLFALIRQRHPGAGLVRGGSWLYNLSAYCRLFPPAFTAAMAVEPVPFPRSAGIWGQFLTSNGTLHEARRQRFLQQVAQARRVTELLQCFPFKILHPTAEIACFYQHFALV